VSIHPYLSIPRRVNPVVGKVIDDWNAKAVDIGNIREYTQQSLSNSV